MARGRNLNGWYALRFQILARDNFTCQYCGRGAPDVMLEVDHKIPVSEGGTNESDNLITACAACNRGKEGLRQSLLYKAREGKPHLVKVKVANENTISRQIERLLAERPMRLKELRDKIPAGSGTVPMVLNRLKHRGKVEKLGGNYWGLSQNSPGKILHPLLEGGDVKKIFPQKS